MIKVPAFSFNSILNGNVRLTDYRGMNIVLYFYPKDNTPGCLEVTEDFGRNLSEFSRLNTIIFGVSRDSVESHMDFKQRYDVPFELISDRDEKFCKHFQVIQEKSWRGITYDSIVRSTLLINAEGLVVKEWRGLNVKGHVATVLDTVREMAKQQNNDEMPRALRYVTPINSGDSLITSL
jgi:thioredoxin-dependent peroxiredoxin